MASITINEISQNYSYNIGTSSFATVALPITSCWGPGCFDPKTLDVDEDEMMESVTWQQFPATQSGLESFVSTYRGPAASYRVAKDYSYQMAMTLLTAGTDDVRILTSIPLFLASYSNSADVSQTSFHAAQIPSELTYKTTSTGDF